MATLGVIFVVVGAALMVAEAHLPSHGVLGTGTAAALTAGESAPTPTGSNSGSKAPR